MAATVYFVSEDGSEHELGSVGEYSIGRGPLLKITDKRISRNHITVKIDDIGNVSMCPKHTNPCYHKRVGAHEFIQLKQGVWQQLSHNDQISLLHYDIKELIFTVKMKDNNVDTEQNVRTDVAATTITVSTTSPPEEVSSSTAKNKPVKPEPKSSLSGLDVSDDSTSNATHSNSVTTSLEPKPVSSTGKTRILPGWLKTMTSNTSSTAEEKPILKKRATSPPPAKKKASSSAEPELTTKQRRSSDDDKDSDIVKEKTGLKKRVSPPSIDTATTTEDNTLSAHPKKETKKEESASKNSEEIVKTKKLPHCPYGKKCYRKNPDHFKEYSHERASSDDEDKPECSYGTSCYRRNPLHRQQYKHTTSPAATGRKRTQTSTRPKREKKAKKSVVVGDSDDDGETNTYDYNDSFIDDEDVEGNSSTSYDPDSEDEDWAPLESSEDVQELVEDANDFISNKKMHKTV